jgi:hypothetical protein
MIACARCGVTAEPVAVQPGAEGEYFYLPGNRGFRLTRDRPDRGWCSWSCWLDVFGRIGLTVHLKELVLMSDDYVPDHTALLAIIPSPAVIPQPTYALVEVFGHRMHYGEIREVEAFGAKLLEVSDVDTGQTHRYGGAAIFSLTMLTQADMDAHLAGVRRQKEREAKWQAECDARRAAFDAQGEGLPL